MILHMLINDSQSSLDLIMYIFALLTATAVFFQDVGQLPIFNVAYT